MMDPIINIAIICYKGFGADGISAFIMNTYKYFDHKKIHCTMIYPTIIGDEKIAEAKLSEFAVNGDDFICIPKTNGIFDYFYKLRFFLKKQKFDAVHIHGSSASIILETLAAKSAGIKTLYAHSHNTTGNHILIHKICRFILNRLVSGPLACGVDAGHWMYGKKKSFQVIPNGIELSKYKFRKDVRNDVRKHLNINDNQILIGHVGGFNSQKNQKFLIDFANLVKKRNLNIHLILIGKGFMLDSVKQYANTLNVMEYVSFLGQRTDVNELMMGMDAFFLPSLFEGFPIVGVEAQASGLPTFMSNSITKEAAMTDLVCWLPIDEGPECWLDSLQQWKSKKDRCAYINEVANYGFDVESSAALLQKIYLDGCRI